MTKSPDAFKTISEVAGELDLPQHVLRFWETRFPQIKPMKRGGGRRYYRPDDVDLLKGIRHLLYAQGYTIKGVKKILKDQGNGFVIAAADGGAVLVPEGAIADGGYKQAVSVAQASAASAKASDGSDASNLRGVLTELLECKRLLDQAR
jgi:DNA-binding transcriptional MerR regulator